MSDFRTDISQTDILTLDGAAAPVATPPADETWFSSNGLYFGFQNASVISQFFRQSNPQPQMTTRELPRSDGQFVESARYKSTQIDIEGTLQAADRATLETLMDAMKRVCSPLVGGTLQLTLAGAPRYFDECYPTTSIGTMFQTRDFYHVLYCPFKISFDCLEPYARSATRTAASPGAVTGNATFNLQNAGSANTDLNATLQIATAGSLSAITVSNAQTGKSMTITRAFRDGDTVEIDEEMTTVKIGGVAVDFSGTFVSLMPGANTLTVSFTGPPGYLVGVTAQAYPRFF